MAAEKKGAACVMIDKVSRPFIALGACFSRKRNTQEGKTQLKAATSLQERFKSFQQEQQRARRTAKANSLRNETPRSSADCQTLRMEFMKQIESYIGTVRHTQVLTQLD